MKSFLQRSVMRAQNTRSDAGFSLIEMVVAMGVFIMVIAGAIIANRALSATLNYSVNSIGDEQFLSSLELQLRHDATSSLDITTLSASAPDNVLSIDRSPGSAMSSSSLSTPDPAAPYAPTMPDPVVLSTADPNNLDTGIEFAVTDAQHRWHRWNYRLQNGTLRLMQDGVSKLLDSRVTTFTAEFIPANRLSSVEQMGNAFSNLPPPATYTLNLEGQRITNGVVRVNIIRGKAHRTFLLATRVAPSGFGIEAGPQWHPTVWRQQHRANNEWVPGTHSYYEIRGAVEYTTDNWKHAKTWCDQFLDRGDGVSSPNTEINWVKRDDSKKREPQQIFQGCQKQTGNREISETPAPKPMPTKRACSIIPFFYCMQ